MYQSTSLNSEWLVNEKWSGKEINEREKILNKEETKVNEKEKKLNEQTINIVERENKVRNDEAKTATTFELQNSLEQIS